MQPFDAINGWIDRMFQQPLAFFIFFEGICLSRWGATPGKRLVGVRVITLDGQTPSFLGGVWRSLTKNILPITALISVLVALANKQRRAIHDYLAVTRVVKRR